MPRDNSLQILELLGDQPIPEDYQEQDDGLGSDVYARILAGAALGTPGPFSIGVFGEWGSGKTSLMKMVKGLLDAQDDVDVVTVWFDAWLYEQDEHPIVPLVVTIIQALKPHKDALAKLADGGKKFLTALLAIAQGFSVKVKAPGATDAEFEAGLSVTDVQEAWEKLNKDALLDKSLYSGAVQALSDAGLGGKLKIIVLVDDLDRCMPLKAIKLLESIKLVLSQPGFIFVLGVSARVIEGYLEHRYKEEYGLDDFQGRSYLEKIIQLPFILPPIEEDPMREYVDSLAPALPDSRCAEVFARGLPPNPRQVKRTLNIFLFLSRLVERQAELAKVITPVRLAKWVAIQHAHPDLYQLLLRRRPGYLRELETFLRAQEAAVRGEGIEIELPRLPEVLDPFAAQESLRRLLCLSEEEDTRFDGLTPLDIRSFITLVKRATPVEDLAVRVRETVSVSEEPSVRVHEGRVPIEPEMVLVPEGPFQMGTSDEQVRAMLERSAWAKEIRDRFEREQPDHIVTLPAFEMGRYPVSNAEYAAFVEAVGHPAPRHWLDSRLPEELADHPVVYVTWHDAQAYVSWLEECTGQPYRLPKEAEWEKAARGTDSRLWPWGDELPNASKCNFNGNIGTTTPVDQYSPTGDSPYGCADMAGNVWEWCQSLYQSYSYQANGDREDPQASGERVRRGGVWYSGPGLVRCASRSWNSPGVRSRHLGFRVARGRLG